jgi:hypothetical protein
MTVKQLAILGAITWVVVTAMTVGALIAVWPDPKYELPTDGVPGCTADSVRSEVVPAGATVAFSCPTHIEVTSMDEHTPTKLVWGRP